jgi:stage III sporulation protein SpoIIIAA
MAPNENIAAMNAAAVNAVLMIGPPDRYKTHIARDFNRR